MNYCWCFLLLMLSVSGFSQENIQVVTGRVVDAELEAPLPGANIVLMNTDPVIGAATDENGYFRLEKVPLGRQSFKVTMIGYEERLIAEVLITAGKEMVLNIKLTESVTQMEEVVIRADGEKGTTINQMATVSARSFSVEETKRYAGSFDDPGRMAQSFAGVSSNSDNSNEIVIRGNSPRGVLWRMEGVEIPNPNHFADQGASGGAISMLSSNMMTNSDFFTGAFPSEYGNALSGVFDIHLRKGNFEKREYAFQLGVLGTDFSMEGPFKKGYKGSYLINYRYSTLSMLNAIGIKIVGDAVPVFQDLSFNFNFPTKKAGTFTLFGLGGISAVKQSWSGNNSVFRDQFSLKMGVTGITHTLFLNQNSYLKTIVSVNATQNDYIANRYDTNNVLQNEDYKQEFLNSTIRGTVVYNNKIDAKNTLRTGVIFSGLGFDFFSRAWDEQIGQSTTFLDRSGNSSYLQSYVSWKLRINENVTLNSGLHYLYFVLNKNQSVEPRLGVKWQISGKHSLNFGTGIHSRMEDMTVYFAQNQNLSGEKFYPNKDLGFTKAAHFVIGYDVQFSKKFHLRSEIYYQYLYNVPVIDKPNSYFSALNYGGGFTTDTLANKGTGTNYGMELTAEKYFSDDWYFMLTGSLYQSEYVGGDGKSRNTRFNGNYATTILGGKEFKMGDRKKKKNIFGISTRITYAGGRRYSPILLNESIAAGYEVIDENHIFENRQKDYFRMDVQITFKRNKNKTTRTWKIDAQNVLNTKNIYVNYYDNDVQEIRTAYQMGFIPVLSYKIEF